MQKHPLNIHQLQILATIQSGQASVRNINHAIEKLTGYSHTHAATGKILSSLARKNFVERMTFSIEMDCKHYKITKKGTAYCRNHLMALNLMYQKAFSPTLPQRSSTLTDPLLSEDEINALLKDDEETESFTSNIQDILKSGDGINKKIASLST